MFYFTNVYIYTNVIIKSAQSHQNQSKKMASPENVLYLGRSFQIKIVIPNLLSTTVLEFDLTISW